MNSDLHKREMIKKLACILKPYADWAIKENQRLKQLEKEEAEDKALIARIYQHDNLDPSVFEPDLICSSIFLPEIGTLGQAAFEMVDSKEIIVFVKNKFCSYWDGLPNHVKQRIKTGAMIAGTTAAIGILLILPRPFTMKGGLDEHIFLKPATKIVEPGLLAELSPTICHHISNYASKEKIFETGIQTFTSVNHQLLLETLTYLNKSLSSGNEVNYLNINMLHNILILCRNATNIS